MFRSILAWKARLSRARTPRMIVSPEPVLRIRHKTRDLLAPISLEGNRGGESLEELRAIVVRTSTAPEARVKAEIEWTMKRKTMTEKEAIHFILNERELGR